MTMWVELIHPYVKGWLWPSSSRSPTCSTGSVYGSSVAKAA